MIIWNVSTPTDDIASHERCARRVLVTSLGGSGSASNGRQEEAWFAVGNVVLWFVHVIILCQDERVRMRERFVTKPGLSSPMAVSSWTP